MTCVYPFGVDPAWALSPNLLTFTNNIKMKLSVIIGVAHMTIGIGVKGLNSLYFGRPIDLIFEVITGFIILLGLFGWMDILIFSKWTFVMNPYAQFDAQNNYYISNAPSIITVMINNFLQGGKPGPGVANTPDPSWADNG
jgi:V-type H+-transporting ATPase subunit a